MYFISQGSVYATLTAGQFFGEIEEIQQSKEREKPVVIEAAPEESEIQSLFRISKNRPRRDSWRYSSGTQHRDRCRKLSSS